MLDYNAFTASRELYRDRIAAIDVFYFVRSVIEGSWRLSSPLLQYYVKSQLLYSPVKRVYAVGYSVPQ